MRRACLICGTPSATRRCPQHTPRKRPQGRQWEATRQAILHRDLWACQLCGKPLKPANTHIDHINPIANGGSDDPSNLRATCAQCNQARGTRPD